VADEWMQVGVEQYERGYYEQSKKSFLKAQDYQKYLTADEREKLNGLLQETDTAIIERKRIVEEIQKGHESVEQGQLIEAKTHLEGIQGNEFLTKEERKVTTEDLKKVTHQLNERKREIAGLYDRSVQLYRAGEMEAAREGFLKIAREPSLWGFAAPQGETAEDYLVKIDNILVKRLESSGPVEPEAGDKRPRAGVVDIRGKLPKIAAKSAQDTKPQLRITQESNNLPGSAGIDVGRVKSPEPKNNEGGYTESESRRRNILRSYTRAVVNDAIAKAQNYREKGEFDKAKKSLEKAKTTVNENRAELGDNIFEQYSRLLEQRAEEIVREQSKTAR
jgi:tetratricopeptide (TPR) repeat protein